MSLRSRFRADENAPRGRGRAVLGGTVTALAALIVYVALIVPDTVVRHKNGEWVPAAFFRLPLELLFCGAVLLVVPVRWRRPVAALFGLGIGVVALLKVFNMGFRTVLGRRFNLVLDPPLLRDGYNALVETDGKTYANAAVVGAILLTVAVLVVLTLAVVRLAGVVGRHAEPARRALIGLTAVWLALALSGLTFYRDDAVASDSAAALLKTTAQQAPAALRDRRQFAAAAQNDPVRGVPARDLVAGLAGKDVLLGVVESYGRSSLTEPSMAAVMDPALAAGTAQLAAAGYHARSGWLTSSTFGGSSWLAHASFQSGLWINSGQRYRQLTASDRITLTSTFHDAGWQTVAMEPGNTTTWPEKHFYKYETVYDSRNIGYRGPTFGWSRIPDQFTLATFQKNVYAARQRPLMAELTLTSSHNPWAPLPEMLDWDQLGDGTVYQPIAERGGTRATLWKDRAKTKVEYAKSVAYSVDTLVSWATKYADKDLVMVIFGDHQPIPMVSGEGASHDVPVTIVAHDPAVLDRIAGWGWTDGLKPAAKAPVWRMDQFRDHFFTAYGKHGAVALGR